MKEITEDELTRIDEKISSFLTKNGFLLFNDRVYVNGICSILITKEGYTIHFKGMSSYIHNHSIFCLIGTLTYYGLMHKNYTQ